MTRRELFAITPGLLLLNCADSAKKAVVKAPEPVTGLHALYQMYTFARPWAQDLEVVRLTSLPIPEMKAVAGKAAAWQVVFSSESLGKVRTYTFSVYDESVTIREGIFAEAVGSLSRDMHPFVIATAATDTDKVWEVGLPHSQKYVDEHKDMPVTYVLEDDRQADGPVWRMIWGVSAASSGFSIEVDARTGSYRRTVS